MWIKHQWESQTWIKGSHQYIIVNKNIPLKKIQGLIKASDWTCSGQRYGGRFDEEDLKDERILARQEKVKGGHRGLREYLCRGLQVGGRVAFQWKWKPRCIISKGKTWFEAGGTQCIGHAWSCCHVEDFDLQPKTYWKPLTPFKQKLGNSHQSCKFVLRLLSIVVLNMSIILLPSKVRA